MDICYVASDFIMLWIKVSRMGLLDVSAFDDDGLYYRNYSIDSKIKKKNCKNMYNEYICYSSINIKSHILFDSRVWIYTGTCC